MERVQRHIDGYTSSDFNFYDLDSWWKVSEINPDVEFKIKEIGDFKIIVADNFLLNPDGFRDFLKKFPGFPNSQRQSMSRPGFSQKLHPELFRHFEFVTEKNYNEIRKASGLDKKYLNFTWATNIMHSGMKLYRNSEIPHYDNFTNFVMNYWMCEGVNNSSISFYEFDGNKKHLWNNKECDKKYIEWCSDYCDKNKVSSWGNFKCDNRWKKYYSSKVKYNRVVFYDPYLYHCPNIKPDSYINDYRYSLVGFGKDISIAY